MKNLLTTSTSYKESVSQGNENIMEMWRNLKFTDDFLFSVAMQDENICRTVLEILLETEISEIKYIHSQDAIKISPGKRGVRLDVRVKSNDQVINVEMQNECDSFLPHRIRYYQAMVDSQQLREGTSYKDLPEFVTLFICTEDPLNADLPAYHIEHKIRENPEIKYDDKRRIVVYNSKAWKKEKNPDIRAFLQYIDGHKPENSERVSEFADDIERFKDDNITAEEFMDYILMKTDLTDKGIEIGERKTRLETARKMLADGFSVELVEKYTSLSADKILELQKEVA